MGEPLVRCRVLLVLRTGVQLGPIEIPWSEAEELRAIVWPATREEEANASRVNVVHLSSGSDVDPPWLLSFMRADVAAVYAEALVEPDPDEEAADVGPMQACP